MSIGVMLFDPYTGQPRHPIDIKSDPQGILIWDGEKPLKASKADTPPLPVQPAQEPVAFAGIEIWVGGARITKHLTQTELHYARDPWMLMQYSAEFCLAKLMEKNNGT